MVLSAGRSRFASKRRDLHLLRIRAKKRGFRARAQERSVRRYSRAANFVLRRSMMKLATPQLRIGVAAYGRSNRSALSGSFFNCSTVLTCPGECRCFKAARAREHGPEGKSKKMHSSLVHAPAWMPLHAAEG